MLGGTGSYSAAVSAGGKVASVTVNGWAGDGFRFVARNVGSLKRGGLAIRLHVGNSNDALAFRGTLDVRLREV